MSTESVVLNVSQRAGKGKNDSRRARANGQIPAIVYSSGKESQSITVPTSEWKVLNLSQVNLLELKDDKGKATNVLVKDYQYDYLADKTLHIDFLEVDMNQVVKATVALKSHGSPIGESQGGLFELMAHEIEISSLPNDIPEFIEVEVSGLNVGDSLFYKDIVLPEGVTLESSPEVIVCHVVEQAAAASEAAKAEEEAE